MIRTSQHTLKFTNKEKLNILDRIYDDCKKQIEVYIKQIISGKLELKPLMSSKELSDEYIKHSAWRQICYGQASEIIRSQTKKATNNRFKVYRKLYAKLKNENRYNKFTSKKFSELKLKPIYHTKYFTKPNLNNISIIITKILLNDSFGSKEFDNFINLTTPLKIKGMEDSQRNSYIHLNIPIKHHKHSNKFRSDIRWKQKNSIGLQKINGNFYFNLFWGKPEVEKKLVGKSIGLDCGYKKLLISSENKIYDLGLEKIYEKISRKKQNSKNFKQALVERDNLINQSINLIDFSSISNIIVEDLKNVKLKSKISKKFNNKLQRWSYLKVLNKLSMLTEEAGINFVKVNPAYTSQTCSRCGSIHKESRKGEKFLCIDCGYEIDADYNAAINILHRGVTYSPSTENKANYC